MQFAQANSSDLEHELEGLMGRLRSLDESEQRYKDENWTLETRIQELVAAAKASAEREAKLSQHVNVASSEKSNVERELEELRQTHGKLSDDHKTSRKQHEAELLNLHKDATYGEGERDALQRKVDELTAQNQELAKAMAYKFRASDASMGQDLMLEDEDAEEGKITPEHSPPPSPTKGTPRHGALESETLKTSLHHAHRMIQNLKNNIHREKTEKLEMRRMLQDARDELEQRRGDHGARAAKKRQSKDELKEFKKPGRPDRLGNARGATTDILVDEDWEDHDGSPSRRGTIKAKKMPGGFVSTTDTGENTTDAFETATEHEDTDAFHTGAESLDDSADSTETETVEGAPDARPTRGHLRTQSYQSTASTSGEDRDGATTPAASARPKPGWSGRNRGSLRSSVIDPHKDSPASIASRATGTSSTQTTPAGPSLYAELGGLSGDEESDLEDGTPSRSLASKQNTPDLQRNLTVVKPSDSLKKQQQRERSTSVEPSEAEHNKTYYEKGRDVVGAALAGGLGFGLGRTSSKSYGEARPGDERPTPPAEFAISSIVSQEVQPVEPALIAAQKSAPQTPMKDVNNVSSPPLSVSRVIEQYAETPVTPRSPAAAGADQSLMLDKSGSTQQNTQPDVDRPSTAKMAAATSGSSAASQTTPMSGTAPDESIRRTPSDSKPGFLGMFGLGKSKAQPEPMIAEDHTSTRQSQPLRIYSDDIDDGGPALPGLENAREPMREIQPNVQRDRASVTEGIALAKSMSGRGTVDGATQTLVSSEDLDKLINGRQETPGRALSPTPGATPTNQPSSPSKAIYSAGSPRKSRDSVVMASDVGQQKFVRRPGSSGSVRIRPASPPPLPADHQQAIAAANAQRGQGTSAKPGVQASQATTTTPGQMGPPAMPASAYRAPAQYRQPSNRGYGGIVATTRTTIRGSGVSTPGTRRSSISSFASEIDQRFNISRTHLEGFEYTSDPRMIQAITKTMIGEFLWKYTRKAGRGTQSSTRHRRFFWVHPYTRTLYWSEQDPALAGRTQLKAKSVKIQSVRDVPDENPLPPGLYRKSLVVVTPGREIMFTAATGRLHETWYNALSYLVLKERPSNSEDTTLAPSLTNTSTTGGESNLTTEDVDEFNPRMSVFGGGATSRMSRRSRTSVASYSTQTTRASSPNRQYPTLVPNDGGRSHSRTSTVVRRSQSQQAATASRTSLTNRLSSFAGSVMGGRSASRHRGVGVGGDEEPRETSSSRRLSEAGTAIGSGAATTADGSIYDASLAQSAHDSAEDLRRVMERQEKEADRLENVRACCDGKHDVGSLKHGRRHSRPPSHRHSSGAPLSARSSSYALSAAPPTPAATTNTTAAET